MEKENTRKEHLASSTNMAAMSSKYNFRCVIQDYTDQNKTNSENGHLVFSVFKKRQENNGVGDISSLFQRHCQTNDQWTQPLEF